jgi:hypothetical protein
LRATTHRVIRSDWLSLILDHHPAYISWEQFLANEQYLDENRCDYSTHRKGAAREGTALLQGIAICGCCGKRMVSRYRRDGVPMYECLSERIIGGRSCQSLRGDYIDEAIVKCLFEALKPAHLSAALQTFSLFEQEAQQIEAQRQRQLERAQYDADLVRRRYLAVDPENRLVARTLEADWNTKLAYLEDMQQEYAVYMRASPEPLTEKERQQILNLTYVLPVIWQAETTTNVQRKQLLRLLITDVTIQRHQAGIDLGIRWQTNVVTQITIPRLLSAAERFRTEQEIITRIRELALTYTDWQIARQLNTEGFQSGRGGEFNKVKVKWLRRTHQIPSGCLDRPVKGSLQPRGDGRYSSIAVAQMLNVTPATVASWCRKGVLDYIRANHTHAPYWIRVSPEQIQQLRKL